MHPELKLSGGVLSDLMQDVLARGALFRFQAKGRSMSPFVKDQDILTLTTPNQKPPAVGDIAAVRRRDRNALIVHRIVKISQDGYLLKGDNQRKPDGVFPNNDIIGIVSSIKRNKKKACFCSRPARLLIAVLSRTGILNSFLLPVMRRLKNSITKRSCSSRTVL